MEVGIRHVQLSGEEGEQVFMGVLIRLLSPPQRVREPKEMHYFRTWHCEGQAALPFILPMVCAVPSESMC